MFEKGTSKIGTNGNAASETRDEDGALKFDSEREKALFEHKLKIFRIVLDKVLWAVVIVILGFAALTKKGYRTAIPTESLFMMWLRG